MKRTYNPPKSAEKLKAEEAYKKSKKIIDEAWKKSEKAKKDAKK